MDKQKQQVDWQVSVAAILALAVLEIFAMSYGINGTMRTIIFTLIALIAGVSIPQEKVVGILKLMTKK